MLTLTALACPGRPRPRICWAAQHGAWRSYGCSALPLLDPDPAGESVLASAMPPEHYEHAVSRAVELASEGKLEKIVLAREVLVQRPDAV